MRQVRSGSPWREDHITRLGEEGQLLGSWSNGLPIPCSEIYFDQGPEFEGEAPGDDDDRYLEFWNLVFTQFDRQEDGSLPELLTATSILAWALSALQLSCSMRAPTTRRHHAFPHSLGEALW